jgi:hypothetical protein
MCRVGGKVRKKQRGKRNTDGVLLTEIKMKTNQTCISKAKKKERGENEVNTTPWISTPHPELLKKDF